MYEKYLKEMPFFKDLEIEEVFENVLDTLTKVVTRKYIIKYINYLIESNIPFSMVIMDLDNFKLINDNYGHVVGDQALVKLASLLMEYVGENGVVGRYGGDEFLIIRFENDSLDSLYDFIYNMYGTDAVIRRTLELQSINPFITGTMGAASFPKDATTYDELFLKADKALYRGKTKGRNCFVIYIEERHKDINTNKIVKDPLSKTFFLLGQIIDNYPPGADVVEPVMEYIKLSLCNSGVLFIDTNARIHNEGRIVEISDKNEIKVIDSLLNKMGMFESNNLDIIRSKSESLYKICVEKKILSILISRVRVKSEDLGYIILTEKNIERLWQEEDLVLVQFACKLIGLNILLKN